MTACLPISSRLVSQGSFLALKHGAVTMLHSSVGALHKDTCKLAQGKGWCLAARLLTCPGCRLQLRAWPGGAASCGSDGSARDASRVHPDVDICAHAGFYVPQRSSCCWVQQLCE
jgi:hypothetical protein